MKAYVITTGVVFGLLTLVHVWRAIEEGPQLAPNPGTFSSPLPPPLSAFGLCGCFGVGRDHDTQSPVVYARLSSALASPISASA